MNFPSSPTVGQTYTLGSKTWVWNGSAWDLQSAAPNNLTLDYVQLNTSATVTDAVGRIRWDADQGTADLGLLGGNIVQRLGQTLVAYVTNAEAVTITKGQAVYLFSAVGDRASVKLAYNTADAASSKTLGIVAEDIAAGASGFVMCQGVAYKMNTAAYNAGDVLYLGATAGSITTTKPYAPNHLVYLGVVEKANAGNGQIYVRVQNGYEMDELHNVSAQSPTTGQTIVYNASTGLWEKNTVSLTAGVNGVLPTTNGGTNLTSFTSGGVVYASSSSALATGSVFTFDGANAIINATTPAYFTGTSNLAQISINRSPSTGAIFNASQSAAFMNIDGASGGSSIQFATASAANTQPSERARIDASGNVGIGTSSPSAKLHVSTTSSNVSIVQSSNANGGYLDFSNGSTSPLYVGFGPTLVTGISTSDAALRYSNNLIFSSGATEAARFVAGGQLCIGKTSTAFGTAGSYFNATGQGLFTYSNTVESGGSAIYLNRLGVDGTIQLFYKDTSPVGSISVTTSATAYNTSSDYRLKNTITPMTGALAKVALLKPCTYKWNVNGSDGEGFIAHELAEVCPSAVTGEKDAVDADGNIKPQGIDVSFLVATLTAAIQELKAEFDAYKASHP